MTHHFSEWQRDSTAGRGLRARLESARPEMAVSVVTVEEQMRGWLAEISRHHDLHRQISPYGKLQRQIEVFADWIILPWDAESARLFLDFRHQGLRIGSLDLKIACIVLRQNATLLTRNALDFGKVPGVRFENWVE